VLTHARLSYRVAVGSGTDPSTDPLRAAHPFAAEQQFRIDPLLVQPTRLGNGVFQFRFTNQTLLDYEVRATTDLSLPVSNWDSLGLPAPQGGGLYQVNDGLAPNHSRRFYLLRQK
jgi:hypothetical protein